MPRKIVTNPPARQLSKERLEEMIEEATVDCHDESEQITGWFTTFENNLVTPFETSVFGVPVVVESVDLTEREQIVAICSRGDARQSIAILDLPLTDPPPEGWEWIEAYRLWSR